MDDFFRRWLNRRRRRMRGTAGWVALGLAPVVVRYLGRQETPDGGVDLYNIISGPAAIGSTVTLESLRAAGHKVVIDNESSEENTSDHSESSSPPA